MLAIATVLAQPLPAAYAASDAMNPFKRILLQAQRKDGGSKLLAPFGSAKIKLEEAKVALAAAAQAAASNGGSPPADSILDALKAARTSSLNCFVFEPLSGDNTETRASLITQQFQIADPCTFRIIAKNVLQFSPANVKDQGYEMVEGIIRSYSLLDEALLHVMQSGASVADVESAQQQLEVTTKQVTALEAFISDILMTPA